MAVQGLQIVAILQITRALRVVEIFQPARVSQDSEVLQIARVQRFKVQRGVEVLQIAGFLQVVRYLP